jgi:hypothetical protein
MVVVARELIRLLKARSQVRLSEVRRCTRCSIRVGRWSAVSIDDLVALATPAREQLLWRRWPFHRRPAALAVVRRRWQSGCTSCWKRGLRLWGAHLRAI